MWFVYMFVVAAAFQILPGYAMKEMETEGMYQGDIQLTPEEWEKVRKGQNAFGSITNRRWPGGRIAYQIESSIGSNGRKEIERAIDDYHKKTCLRFHKRTNERNYISFFNGKGCNSPVGMYGQNRISLEYPGCQNKGTIMHEIGHSIGLHHEQCRPDRDQYVRVHYNNIDGPWAYAFNIERSINSLGTPYDFQSMMHYSSTAFAKRGKKTITTLDPSKQKFIDTYNRITGFSQTDITQINLMYRGECAKGPGTGTGTGGGNNCRDDNTSCSSWARSGYCRSNSTVRKMCCASCKQYGK